MFLEVCCLVKAPKALGEKDHYSIDFESACYHKESHEELRKSVEHAEISAAAGFAHCDTCIGEDSECGGQRRFHIEVVQRQHQT